MPGDNTNDIPMGFTGYGDTMSDPTKNATDKYTQELTNKFTKMQIIKNLFVVSFGFLFLFTAFQSMANLQSSLNLSDGVGSASLSTVYAALVVSCLFVPPFVIAHLGCKWTIPISMVGYVLYMAANFYPKWGLMIPAAIILGLGAAPLWSAKCTYLTQMGVWYAKLTGKSEDAIINAFFGIFFMIFQTSQIWGNLISSTAFKTNGTLGDVDLTKCGANYCVNTTHTPPSLERPVETQIYIVCGTYTACAIAAVLIMVFLLDKIQLDKDDGKTGKQISPKLLVSTLQHLWKSHYQKLLIPLTIYSGVEQAFIGGDFTRSYVTCSLGIWNVGYVMICYGVVDALCSLLFGRLVQYVGHIPFFILAFVVHGSCQVALLLWTPDPSRIIIYYVIAGFWGMGDAVIQTQINAYYGYLFTSNTEAAFANYRLWESLGFIVTYAYNDSLCTYYKIYVCMAVLCVGMIGYGITEVLVRRDRSDSATVTKS